MRICSTEYVYHALLNPEFDKVESILNNGIRPLSDFPESERASRETLAIPVFPELKKEQQDYVVAKIAEFFA